MWAMIAYSSLHSTVFVEAFHLISEIFVFKLQTELENLSTRLEEYSLQFAGEKQQHAQICTASVAVVTDTDVQGMQNTTLISRMVPPVQPVLTMQSVVTPKILFVLR